MKSFCRLSPVLVVSLSFLCICLLLSTITVAVHAQLKISENEEKCDMGSVNYRLPRRIIPINYKLHLRPNTRNKTFDGNVNITIKTLEPTDVITLHSNKLIIHSVSLKDDSENYIVLVVSSNLTNDKREFLNIYLQHKIPAGKFVLEIDFSGSLNGLVGFYASKLKNSK